MAANFAEPKGPGPFDKPMKTPDYNPDKERHVDHTFVIHPAAGGSFTELKHGDKTIKMNKDGRAFIKDEGLAREIQKEHRFDAVVTRMASQSPADRGHKYFFTMPEMPWKRKVNNGEGQEQSIKEDTQANQGRGLQPRPGNSNRPEHEPQTAAEEPPP